MAVGMEPEKSLAFRYRAVRAVRLPMAAGMVPAALAPWVKPERSREVTRPPLTVTPFQVLVALKPVPVVAMRLAVAVAPVPHWRRPCVERRLLLAELAERWVCRATRAWQSSTKSLLAPTRRGLAVVSTKVPSVQPEAVRAVKAVLAAGPIRTEIVASWVSPPEEV